MESRYKYQVQPQKKTMLGYVDQSARAVLIDTRVRKILYTRVNGDGVLILSPPPKNYIGLC